MSLKRTEKSQAECDAATGKQDDLFKIGNTHFRNFGELIDKSVSLLQIFLKGPLQFFVQRGIR